MLTAWRAPLKFVPLTWLGTRVWPARTAAFPLAFPPAFPHTQGSPRNRHLPGAKQRNRRDKGPPGRFFLVSPWRFYSLFHVFFWFFSITPSAPQFCSFFSALSLCFGSSAVTNNWPDAALTFKFYWMAAAIGSWQFAGREFPVEF